MITQKFVNDVRSMQASEIIETMITGLENPVTTINMLTFGIVRDGICFGCAATNTIAKLACLDETKVKLLVGNAYTEGFSGVPRKESVREFVALFECTINALRMGNIFLYNDRAKGIGIAEIKVGMYLPYLDTDDYKEKLHHYKELARKQKEWENNNL